MSDPGATVTIMANLRGSEWLTILIVGLLVIFLLVRFVKWSWTRGDKSRNSESRPHPPEGE